MQPDLGTDTFPNPLMQGAWPGYLQQSAVATLAFHVANLGDRARSDADGTAVAGPETAHQPSLRRPLILGVVATVAIVCGALAGGRMFVSTLPGAWFFGPTSSAADSAASGQPSVLALIGVYGGIIVLARAWLDLLRVSRSHRGMPVRRVAGVIGAWAVPLALAPPLFSRDVYSYAGQGEMVAHGISPYLYGTGVLGVTPFSTLPGTFWANTPSPYGPTFLWLDGFATHLARHQILADLVLLRPAGRGRPGPGAVGHPGAGPGGRAGRRPGRGAGPGLPPRAHDPGRWRAQRRPHAGPAPGRPGRGPAPRRGARDRALRPGRQRQGAGASRRAVPGLELAGPDGPAHSAARSYRGRLRHRAGHSRRGVLGHSNRMGLGPHGGGPDQGHHRHHAGRLGVPSPDRHGAPGRLQRRLGGGPFGGRRRRARQR